MLAGVNTHHDQSQPPSSDLNLAPRPGTRIDDFTVAYRIACGMNADLFAVWHHGLRTPLVCKRLRPAAVVTDDDEHNRHGRKWRTLLRREGATLARLCHPGIVRLIGQRHDGEAPYLLLEHVGEQTLRDELRARARLPVDVSVRIVQHVGAAVAHAHARGYLHRDLKPSNVILRGGRPVLLDFGVAWKYAGNLRPPDRSGTPQRLAPEQITREPLTPPTDVFGLGVLLFELLTGVRPFRPGGRLYDLQAPLSEWYPQLLEPPLTLRRAGRRAPARLEGVVARCLAKDPSARFADVPQLLTALDEFTPLKVWPCTAVHEQPDFSPFIEETD